MKEKTTEILSFFFDFVKQVPFAGLSHHYLHSQQWTFHDQILLRKNAISDKIGIEERDYDSNVHRVCPFNSFKIGI